MTDQELMQEAIKARENAYVPYSKFKVGAALITKAGKVYRGCNIENASYPVCTCGERTAIVKAVSEGEKEFAAIAVVADTPGPCSPCGMCRQAIAEFNIPKIIMGNLKGDTRTVTLDELIPFYFTEDDMQNAK